MGKVYLLDCTLRDGGYINDWNFGFSSIKGIIHKLNQTGLEYIEVGFMKNIQYDPNKTLFSHTDQVEDIIPQGDTTSDYVVMVDMSDPVPLSQIAPCSESSLVGVRVIFKKNKIQEGYEYCKALQEKGYQVFANFVSTDAYSDIEFIETIELFNTIKPTGVTIVDTFGAIKLRQFKRLLMIADNNLDPDIMLCYHAHNNLQQAMMNAQTMVDMNMKRDILIDACVFGMGRGAGNLNLELFAEYMNENHGTRYDIQPMLEIMDEYLSNIYRSSFWGYSLPLYLSASLGYHPNYAVYIAEKNTLPIKQFYELLQTIPVEYRDVFKKDIAEKYYREFFLNSVDDSEAVAELKEIFAGKRVMVIAPGKSIQAYREKIRKEKTENTVVILVNFYTSDLDADYVFISNKRRFQKMRFVENVKVIATSNVAEEVRSDYIVNFRSYTGGETELFDNSGLMLLRLLCKTGVSDVCIAGMDGYSSKYGENYYNSEFEAEHLSVAKERNDMIRRELKTIGEQLSIEFITPSAYV